MAGSLYPAFVQIEYASEFAPHVMTLPTREWNDAGGTPDSGEFECWDSSFQEADTMITDFILLLSEMFPASVNFNRYTIFTMSAPVAPAIPVYTQAIDYPGLSVAPGWYKAVQQTWSFKTTVASDAKLVLLDAASANAFNKLQTGGFSADVIAIANAYGAPTNGWSARVDGRPFSLNQITFTLNEKLRRNYNMT